MHSGHTRPGYRAILAQSGLPAVRTVAFSQKPRSTQVCVLDGFPRWANLLLTGQITGQSSVAGISSHCCMPFKLCRALYQPLLPVGELICVPEQLLLTVQGCLVNGGERPCCKAAETLRPDQVPRHAPRRSSSISFHLWYCSLDHDLGAAPDARAARGKEQRSNFNLGTLPSTASTRGPLAGSFHKRGN